MVNGNIIRHTMLLFLFLLTGAVSLCGQTPSRSVRGASRCVEYIAGDLPLIITVPHGGDLKPVMVADRTYGVFAKDRQTRQIAAAMVEEFIRRTGHSPFVVISLLNRKKLDVNREEMEGAQDDLTAQKAWREYHAFIDTSLAQMRRRFGGGMLVDLHGQAHPEKRIEIGYRFDSEEYDQHDSLLNSTENVEKSTLKYLVRTTGISHARLLRGPESLGAMFDARHVRSTPSPSDPAPSANRYFAGGYTVQQHVAEDTTSIFGMQLELNEDLREEARVQTTAVMLTNVLWEYLTRYQKNVEIH